MDITGVAVGMMETWGAAPLLATAGLAIGLAFGAAAQASRFCLRAAVLEFGEGRLHDKMAVWLAAFAGAMLLTQLALAAGLIERAAVRQLSAPGSFSGPVIGGLVFGVGMVMARACPSRMLVLSGQGNLRMLVAGMVFAVVGAATWRGLLSPLRLQLANLWPAEAQSRDLARLLALGQPTLIAGATLLLAIALALGWRSRVSAWRMVGAVMVGGAVAAAWTVTALLGAASFGETPVQGITFSGPSSDVLLRVVSPPERPLDFDTMLVPGVFLGAFLAARLTGSFRIEGFSDAATMPRYLVGAALMGFGSMLAGGCAVGAGVTGGAVLSTTALAALTAMWFGALIAQRAERLIDVAAEPSPRRA